ncbi:hypothetical protein LEP1GSC192_0026 [Leptospira sp. B5-022]|nr:hypothetical protein LEP1GSC192_0026 [Leptospira sp. B5-022]
MTSLIWGVWRESRGGNPDLKISLFFNWFNVRKSISPSPFQFCRISKISRRGAKTLRDV